LWQGRDRYELPVRRDGLKGLREGGRRKAVERNDLTGNTQQKRKKKDADRHGKRYTRVWVEPDVMNLLGLD